jgi:hypothetical protein
MDLVWVDWTTIFEWYMPKLLIKNRHLKVQTKACATTTRLDYVLIM